MGTERVPVQTQTPSGELLALVGKASTDILAQAGSIEAGKPFKRVTYPSSLESCHKLIQEYNLNHYRKLRDDGSFQHIIDTQKVTRRSNPEILVFQEAKGTVPLGDEMDSCVAIPILVEELYISLVDTTGVTYPITWTVGFPTYFTSGARLKISGKGKLVFIFLAFSEK